MPKPRATASVIAPRLASIASIWIKDVGRFFCAVSRRQSEPVCEDARVHHGRGGQARASVISPASRSISVAIIFIRTSQRAAGARRRTDAPERSADGHFTKYWSPKGAGHDGRACERFAETLRQACAAPPTARSSCKRCSSRFPRSRASTRKENKISRVAGDRYGGDIAKLNQRYGLKVNLSRR